LAAGTGGAPGVALLEGTGLRKRFGSTEALRGVDIRIVRGEIVAVMGPSGSGKSTLLHCLAGILTPDEGTVTFDGRPVDSLAEGDRTRLRRTSFGFLFQAGQLVPELDAIENVSLPLLLNGVSRARAEEVAAAWFPRLGRGGLERRRPGEMSGGQAQRVAIARAMVIEPAIVFADEPTGSLDSLAGEQVMELLTAAAGERGTSVILVTHEPRVAAYAHREVVVRDGRVSAPGHA
jgi:putative ABC transport system ATP-binding protein